MAVETADISAAKPCTPSGDDKAGQYGVLGAKRTRVTLQIIFAIMTVIMNCMIMSISMSPFAKVPPWLRAFNFVWVGAIVLVYLYITAALFMPEMTKRVTGARMHDFATSEVYAKRRIVYAALILPFNVIWFYMFAGHPALIDGDCAYYQDFRGDGIMVSAPGSVYPPRNWIATNLTEIPAQPNCESVVNTILDGTLGLSGDRWDEIFDFIMRIFSFAAGGVADAEFATLEGDFLADITDIFDLYTLSFENVNLMKEGKTPLWVGKISMLGASFDWATSMVILLSYIMAILRATKILMTLFAYTTGRKLEEVEATNKRCTSARDRALSLTQEVSFLIVRLVAWIQYEIPMSLFILKNVFSIWVEAQEAWKPFRVTSNFVLEFVPEDACAEEDPPKEDPAAAAGPAREAWQAQATGQAAGKDAGGKLGELQEAS